MVITYEGVEFIKITQGDMTIAFNPVSKKSKLKGSNFGADIALISANHPDFNGADSVTRKDKEPFVVNGPGEYEIGGLFIQGFYSNSTYDNKEMANTIYVLEVDGIRVAYFGAMYDKDLSADVKEKIGDVDIIFVPIGGDGVLDPAEAHKLAVKREPSIIIPIHFDQVGDKNALKKFLEEGSAESVKPVDKLTVKKKDLVGKEGEIVVLKSSN